MADDHEVDLLVIGAGPVGLFAAYYSGFRGLSVGVVDSLPELGGQITAMYPEKDILDVAGFPVVKGKDLVAGLVAQAATSQPRYFLDRTAQSLESDEAAGEVRVGLDDGTTVVAKAVIITAGIGKFTPRPLPAATEWDGDGVAFFVPSFAEYAGKDVVIVGGGDSAFDWCIALEPVAASVTLVHRRDAFRAHQRTVDQVMDSTVTVLTSSNVSKLVGDGSLEAVEVEHVKTKEVTTLKCQAVVAALGFVADLGPIQQWGIEVQKRHVVVDSTTRTNLPRVFAAGDITEYPGKVRLIAVGFGEAATAVNNAAVAINPDAHLFPGHSSEGELSMASGRSAVSMSEDEVENFLADSLKVQVASIGSDGAPHLTTLFYVLDDGKIAFWTYRTSQKIKNLERDPRITCLVETGTDYFELAGVSIQGTAEIVRDEDRIRVIGSKVVTAMSGGVDLGELGADIVEKQVKKRVGIVVTPTRTASWDHSKMSSLPGGGEKP